MAVAVTKLTGIYSVKPIEGVSRASNVKLSDQSSSGNNQNGAMEFKEILAKVSKNHTEEKAQRSNCYSSLGVEVITSGYCVFDASG